MASEAGKRWFPIVPGIRRRTLVWGDRMMQIEVLLDAGAQLPEHQHPHEQIVHVVQGRLRVLAGGVPHELGPGEALMLLGNVPHFVEALEASRVIDTFSPPREDFLAQDRGE